MGFGKEEIAHRVEIENLSINRSHMHEMELGQIRYDSQAMSCLKKNFLFIYSSSTCKAVNWDIKLLNSIMTHGVSRPPAGTRGRGRGGREITGNDLLV